MNKTHTLTINGLECTATVRVHDTSVSGLQYKLVVTFAVNMLPRRRSMMHQIYCKPKPARKPKYDLGTWANDVGNALGRELGFKYGWYPSIDKGRARNTTEFSFFFSDTAHAVELGFVESECLIRARLRMEADGAASGLTAFESRYRRV